MRELKLWSFILHYLANTITINQVNIDNRIKNYQIHSTIIKKSRKKNYYPTVEKNNIKQSQKKLVIR